MRLTDPTTHPRDERIFFDEEPHKYYIDGSTDGYISSTTLIHTYFKPFDAKQIAIQTFKKYHHVAGHKYFGMTASEIETLWSNNDAAQQGTKLHHDIENHINQNPTHNESEEFQYFLKFADDFQDLIPFRTEWTIFDEVHKVSGSIDIVFKGKNGGIILGDWKRSKEIRYGNKYQYGVNGLEHVQDCNFNHYALQLNLYRYILETHYEQRVEGMFLVVLHPTNESYKKINIPRLEDDVVIMLNNRPAH